MKQTAESRARMRGFALVVTLSLMILLTVVAVGLLGISAVSLRSTSQGVARSEAQSNARLALMLAIGELQKQAGADTRITASADILKSDNPPLTGVWKSWEGKNQQQSGNLKGRPLAPDYASKAIPASSGNGRFLSWLVSGGNGVSLPADAASLVRKTASSGTIPLVSTGSLADTDLRQVHVVPQKVGNKGAMAWWVSGENQKALSPKPSDKANPSTAQWADRNRSHAVTDPEPFGMNRVLTDPVLARKAISRGSADFITDGAAAVKPTKSFHDLSANASGLLTNVATGGWRKDLSLLTESWDAQPTSGLEFFNISPTETLKYTRPANATDYQPANSMLYHWADYRSSTLREYWARRGPIASWAKIKNYATLYKRMSATTTSAPNLNCISWPDDGSAAYAALTFHDIRIMPQMARVQMIVSHYATTVGATPGMYRPAVLYTPIVTLWNPYNVRITLNGRLMISPAYTWPLALRHKLSGASLDSEYWAVQGGSSLPDYQNKSLATNQGIQDYRLNINQDPDPTKFKPLILDPGETRIFSPSAGSLQDVTTNNSVRATIDLSPGVRTGAGVFYTLDRRITGSGSAAPFNMNTVSLPGSASIGVDAKFDVPSRKTATSGNIDVCGSAYQWFVDNYGSGKSHSWFQIFYARSDADKLYPPITGLATATLAQCAIKPMPFLSMTLGSRISNYRATATKGMVQANPVVDFFASNGEARFTDTYPGNENLLNCPWDFSVVEHPSGGGDMLPDVDNTTNSSYIVTGVRKADGVSRMIIAELPARPLVSLADLSQMDIRGLNPTPPYSGNVVANSDASPLIPKDNIVNTASSRANARDNEQQDDSYCANQVLFDDWFFSSIIPVPSGFGSSVVVDQQKIFTDWLAGNEPLTNRAYTPIREDQVTDSTKAGAIYSARVQPPDSWKTIASRIEVEGMFNVNSTSVKAWRALLGHARNQKLPYAERSGSITLAAQADYAVSRTSVAGDRAAGEPPQVAGEYADTTQFTGYRVFTDEKLDFLAEKIVEQVRKRGPFLSLSEFVNRQLSTDAGLAMGGAIQTALNAFAANSSLNPFETIQNESVASSATPFAASTLRDTGYVFPEAAIGYNTYGLPGWTRQADILRPLAPILSARDDTFTVRAYGESRSADGSVQARAWCEASIRRTRDFIDPSDAPDITTIPLSPTNLTFGRKFEIISFRWLNRAEV